MSSLRWLLGPDADLNRVRNSLLSCTGEQPSVERVVDTKVVTLVVVEVREAVVQAASTGQWNAHFKPSVDLRLNWDASEVLNVSVYCTVLHFIPHAT